MGENRIKSVDTALDAYRRKRAPTATPEPMGGHGSRGLFVVQHHAARSLHYDLRLEIGGVLESWAVPKGPSGDPTVKRLAMQVEQHPLDYAGFEGRIPEGNYGAGSVIVWDRGRWVDRGDASEGLRKGKLLFDLYGYKLRGRWTLFRIGKKPNEWLLMKKPDEESGADIVYAETSILSGLRVDQLGGTGERRETLRAELSRCCKRTEWSPRDWQPLLAQPIAQPPSGEDWIHEIKYDGYRMLAARQGSEARLTLRNGGDATRRAPEIVDVLRHLPVDDVAMDGEWVALDSAGRPDFGALQRGAPQGTVFFAFDLLRLEGFDLTPLPLLERKQWLRRVVPELGPVRYVEHVVGQGPATYQAAAGLELEGIVSKRSRSQYRPGRSSDWRKIHVDREGEFAIVGYRPERGRRSGIGALELGRQDDSGQWRSCGSVGSGLDEPARRRLIELLNPAKTGGSPIPGMSDDTHPVQIENVCVVRFREWTAANRLRHPIFLRLLEGRSPATIATLSFDEGPEVDDRLHSEAAAPVATMSAVPPASVPITNPDKMFWPADGITKADLVRYYDLIAPWILPYLDDRPVVLQRYPDGIDGKNFFQKDAPDFVPEWIRTHSVWTEGSGREIHYFIGRDAATLSYLINLGAIPLHIWSSRTVSPNQPDWSILDLDPGPAPFRHVIRIAQFLHEVCDEIGLPSYVKTSGSSGLHVLIPMGSGATYDHSRSLAELLATLTARELPKIATIARARSARQNRVYVDFLQNGRGSLLVAPFSVRPLPGAPVSMPLRWEEVRSGLKPARFNLRSALRRMSRLGKDPLRGIFREQVDWPGVLGRLDFRISL